MKRIEEFIWKIKSIGTYHNTRNQLMGYEYSSKLSAWLSNGSISIRDVYDQALQFDEKHGDGKGTKKLIDELFWRDFCRYFCLKNGYKVFSAYGIQDRDSYNWKTNHDII